MPKLMYYIDKSTINTKTGFCHIKQCTHIENKTINRTTGQKCKPVDWSVKKQRVLVPKGLDYNHQSINLALDNLQNRFNQYAELCNNRGSEITVTMIKAFFDGKVLLENPSGITFWQAKELYIQYCDQQQNINTISPKKSIFNVFQNFEISKNYKITWNSIDTAFYDLFKDYCLKTMNYKDNYFASILTRFQVMMNWAFERKYHSNIEYKKFKAKIYENTIVYLIEEEVSKLAKHDFKNEKENQIRDIFITGCLTGLAYVDLKGLKREHLTPDKNYIIKQRVKTNNPLKIPLHEIVQRIFEKYDGKVFLLPVKSNNHTNQYLKEICKKAEINSLVETTKYISGKKIIVSQPKYELIGTHTARKTFITLMYEKGMDMQIIMAITGIRRMATLKHYFNISMDKLTNEMNKIHF